jgi:hypothetical protein
MVTFVICIGIVVEPLLQTSANVSVELAYGRKSVVLNSVGSSGSWLTGIENTVMLSTDALKRQSSTAGSAGAWRLTNLGGFLSEFFEILKVK